MGWTSEEDLMIVEQTGEVTCNPCATTNKKGGDLLGVLAVACYTSSILELQQLESNRVSVSASMLAALVGLYYPAKTSLMHIVIKFL